VIVISLKGGTDERPSVRSTVIGPCRARCSTFCVGYRGAILSLQLPDFVLAATYRVTISAL
jgi:hypothetical protein